MNVLLLATFLGLLVADRAMPRARLMGWLWSAFAALLIVLGPVPPGLAVVALAVLIPLAVLELRRPTGSVGS